MAQPATQIKLTAPSARGAKARRLHRHRQGYPPARTTAPATCRIWSRMLRLFGGLRTAPRLTALIGTAEPASMVSSRPKPDATARRKGVCFSQRSTETRDSSRPRARVWPWATARSGSGTAPWRSTRGGCGVMGAVGSTIEFAGSGDPLCRTPLCRADDREMVSRFGLTLGLLAEEN